MTVGTGVDTSSDLRESPVGRHRFTVTEYLLMSAIGLFGQEARVELIEGEVIDLAAKGEPHVRCLMRAIRLFTPHVTGDLWLAVQDPVRLDPRSQPEPDLLICRVADPAGPSIPDAANTLVVAEVADSSLQYDRATKVPLYGRAGIPEMWVVDLVNGRVERYREPSPAGYRLIVVAHRGESLHSTVLPELVLDADWLLA
ncbi:MAG TPA: Uma2 family endonuclease [Thermomicrobiales bacterium]|jgi:Uma2 family endonuclease